MQRLLIQDWSLGRVVRAMDGRMHGRSLGQGNPTGVATDTRSIALGELFVALRGDRFDGHDFVDDAVSAGACAVVVEDRSAVSSQRATVIVVDDCYQALARLGHAVFCAARQDGMHTIALTGSNGKTTTKEMLAALWSLRGDVWATPGNFNNHIGVPLTLCAIPANCDHLIVELGANHRGEISKLIKMVPAEQRIITSIGRAHLEGFGSMAGVRKAKGEIFEGAERDTTAIVPWAEGEALLPYEFPGNFVTFGDEQDAQVRIASVSSRVESGSMAMAVTLEARNRKWTLSLPLMGRHNASNLAAAMATFFSAGIEIDGDAINGALADLELPGGRLRIESVGSLKVMDDAYNANPSSMRASFRAFEEWSANDGAETRLAVIGDMHELGEAAELSHRELAAWLTDRRCLSALAFVGEFGPSMTRVARNGGINEVIATTDLDEVAQWLNEHEHARVFIKGSRANRLERIVDKLKSQS